MVERWGGRWRSIWHQWGYIRWNRLGIHASNSHEFSVTVYIAIFPSKSVRVMATTATCGWHGDTEHLHEPHSPSRRTAPVLLGSHCPLSSVPLKPQQGNHRIGDNAGPWGNETELPTWSPVLGSHWKSNIINTFYKLFTAGAFSSLKDFNWLLVHLSLSLRMGLGGRQNRQRFKSIYSLYALISYISLSYLFFGVSVFSFVKWDKYYLWYRIIDTPINQSTPININKYLPSVLQKSLGISFLINHHLFMSNSGFSFYLFFVCVAFCTCNILKGNP